MKEEGQIIVAQPQHLQVIVSFSIGLVFQAQKLKLDQHTLTKAWERLLNIPKTGEITEDGIVLLKVVQTEIVGMLRVFSESPQSAWLRSAYIRPQHRGQGHFKSLWNAVRDLIKQKGFKDLSLDAYRQNMEAVKIYKKLGMQQTSDIKYKFHDSPFSQISQHQFKIENEWSHQERDAWCRDKQNIFNGEKYDSKSWNRGLVILDGHNVIGYSSYFYFFEHQINEPTPFIRSLFVEQAYQQALLNIQLAIVRELRQRYPTQTCQVRTFYQGQPVLTEGKIEPYDVYTLKL